MPRADVLRIHGGLHDGAEAALPPGRHSVGDSFDDDVVLIGDGLEAGHVTLVIEPGRFRAKRCVRAHATLQLAGQVLEEGEERPVRLPVSLQMGDALMTWEAGAPSTARRSLRRAAQIGTVLAGGASIAFIAAALQPPSGSVKREPPVLASAGQRDDAIARFRAAVREHERRTVPGVGSRKDDSRAPVAAGTALTAGPDDVAAPRIDDGSDDPSSRTAVGGPTAQRARDEVVRRLAAQGLRGVDLVPREDTLVASGTLEPQHRPAWQQTQRWFDEQFVGKVQLVNEVRFRSGTRSRPPTIQAVWLGDPSYVVVADEKHMLGAAIRGGWTVEAIRSSGVVFARDETSETVTVKF